MTLLTPPRTFAALLLVALALGDAHAQSDREVKIELLLPDNNGNYVVTTDTVRITRYFNQARCQCADYSASDPESIFKIRLTLADPSAPSQQAKLQVGTNCANERPELRNCEDIETIEDIQNLRGGREYDIPVDFFMFPNNACQPLVVDSNVWVLYDDGANGVIDEYYTLAQAVQMDAQPPPLPDTDKIDIDAAEGAVQVSWALPAQRPGDVAYYHVLCVKQGTTTPLFPNAGNDARYDTTQELCNLPTTYDDALPPVFEDLDPSFICGTTTGTGTSIRVDRLENLESYEFALVSVDSARNVNAMYLGDAVPAPAVDFWEEYQGRGGSADGGMCLVTSTYGDGSGMTQALRDFRDGTLASAAPGRAVIDMYYAHVAPLGAYVERSAAARVVAAIVIAPLAGLAAFWEYTGPGIKLLTLAALCWLVHRRRRRKRGERGERGEHGEAAPQRPRPMLLRPAFALAALGVLVWTAPASAQIDPYWSEFEPVVEAELMPRSAWNMGIKLGPYLPAIDSEFDLAPGEAGPYERMFGGGGLMGAVELDRFFLWPLGQLGLTTSIGWMSKSASAFKTVACVSPTEPGCIKGVKVAVDGEGNPIVSPGDTTSFRLVPATLGAVYRFTALDDLTRIPLVPYGKAGLSYYVWWITQPSGALAEGPTEACPNPDDPNMNCEGSRALGATLGWQVSLGLAVRAERLDPQAARSLRQDFGVEHAGFYAELTYAKVDGLGSDNRLHVGDLTWFAGMNFEF